MHYRIFGISALTAIKFLNVIYRAEVPLRKVINLIASGIAFPTCISVNNVICHYSPLISEPDTVLADGDMVKFDLGAHIDGFIAVVAHTFVVGENKEGPLLYIDGNCL